MKPLRLVLLAFGGVMMTLLIVVFVAAATSLLAYRAFLGGAVSTSLRYQKIALPLTSTLSSITLRSNKTLRCWETGLELLSLFPSLEAAIVATGDIYNQSGAIALVPFETIGIKAEQSASDLGVCLDSNWIARALISQAQRDSLRKELTTGQVTLHVLNSLFASNQTWVIMFQNTNELRPTGGFTGSYALVEIRDKTLQIVAVEDIYDADGQVQRFREAPLGISTYTSGNDGLHLQDANWWPDFPTSAQTQLDFLAEAGKKNLTGLVSVNLTLLQDILRIIGPLPLPDYQTTLTPENAPLLLRAHAENFFPSSRGKKQLLTYALQQLRYQVFNLTADQRQELLLLFKKAVETKEIQFFSTVPDQQSALKIAGAAATLEETTVPIIALVEANVGINKSNQYISRSMAVEQRDDVLEITLSLKNNADQLAPSLPASQSGYVDYQRIISSKNLPTTAILSEQFQEIPSAESDWIASDGTPFNDRGFLLTVLPGQTQVIRVRLQRTDPAQPVLLWHQSGTGKIPLTLVEKHGETRTVSFEKDMLITP